MDESKLQVVVLSGPSDPQRAVFALSAAMAAAASGIEVYVVFSMHGAHWASPHTGAAALVPEFPSIQTLLGELIDLGVQVEACATCVDNYCPSEITEGGARALRPGVKRVGLGLVSMRMADMPTITC